MANRPPRKQSPNKPAKPGRSAARTRPLTREAFLAESDRSRTAPSQRDFSTTLFSYLSGDDEQGCEGIHQRVLADWLIAHGYDFGYPLPNHPLNSPRIAPLLGNIEAANSDRLPVGAYGRRDGQECCSPAEVIRIAADTSGTVGRLSVRLCAAHAPQGRALEVRVWFGCQHPDGCYSHIWAHEPDSKAPVAAPDFVSVLLASGHIYDTSVGDYLRTVPQLLEPGDAETAARSIAKTLSDASRNLPVALVVIQPIDDKDEPSASPFGQAASDTIRQRQRHARADALMGAIRAVQDALLGRAAVIIVPVDTTPLLSILLTDSAPRTNEVTIFGTRFNLANDVLSMLLDEDETARTDVTRFPLTDRHFADPSTIAKPLLEATKRIHGHRIPGVISEWARVTDDVYWAATEVHADVTALAAVRDRLGLSAEAAGADIDKALTAHTTAAASPASPVPAPPTTSDAQNEADAVPATSAPNNPGEAEAASLREQFDQLLLEQQAAEVERIDAVERLRRLAEAVRASGLEPEALLAEYAHSRSSSTGRSGASSADDAADPEDALPRIDADLPRPASFAELVGRFDDLAPYVLFTGDPAVTADLDAHDSLGALVASAWEVLLVLADYAHAKQTGLCTSGIEGYLTSTPTGYRGLSLRRFVPREARGTMEAWGNDRVFPLPAGVIPGDEAVMEAHFRLPHVGMVSPRLHLLDRTHLPGGAVYVGYIGPHLRTKSTN